MILFCSQGLEAVIKWILKTCRWHLRAFRSKGHVCGFGVLTDCGERPREHLESSQDLFGEIILKSLAFTLQYWIGGDLLCIYQTFLPFKDIFPFGLMPALVLVGLFPILPWLPHLHCHIQCQVLLRASHKWIFPSSFYLIQGWMNHLRFIECLHNL